MNLNHLKKRIKIPKNLRERKLLLFKIGSKLKDTNKPSKMGTNTADIPQNDASNSLLTLIFCSNSLETRWKYRFY